MNITVKHVFVSLLAIVVGVFIGVIVNGGLIALSPYLIAPPEGVNPMDEVSLRENIDKFTFRHYIVPFLAHALGTLVGAFVATKIAKRFKIEGVMLAFPALAIALLFMWGGISTSRSINAPFVALLVDAVLCYIPMAILGYMFVTDTDEIEESIQP